MEEVLEANNPSILYRIQVDIVLRRLEEANTHYILSCIQVDTLLRVMEMEEVLEAYKNLPLLLRISCIQVDIVLRRLEEANTHSLLSRIQVDTLLRVM
jgi:hypothetical protein